MMRRLEATPSRRSCLQSLRLMWPTRRPSLRSCPQDPRQVLASIRVCLTSLTCTLVVLTISAELISAVPSWNLTFVSRNFTDAEIAYCRSQPSPPSSFAARWVGKEAVFKALGVSSKGAAAPMKDIEILPDASGVPTVTLHGDAKAAAAAKGIVKVHVSLSHSEVCIRSRNV